MQSGGILLGAGEGARERGLGEEGEEGEAGRKDGGDGFPPPAYPRELNPVWRKCVEVWEGLP